MGDQEGQVGLGVVGAAVGESGEVAVSLARNSHRYLSQFVVQPLAQVSLVGPGFLAISSFCLILAGLARIITIDPSMAYSVRAKVKIPLPPGGFSHDSSFLPQPGCCFGKLSPHG
jgi:hypothetical protein